MLPLLGDQEQGFVLGTVLSKIKAGLERGYSSGLLVQN